MVNEVNKLIYNTLVSEKSVYLPEIGTIILKRTPATAANKGVILPPTYSATFSSQQHGVSLVDVIAHAANTTTPDANDIYQRWLNKVRSGSVITIDGVGELRNKSFVVSTELLSLFNSQQPITIRVKSHKKWGIAIRAAVCITAIAVGTYFYLSLNDNPNTTTDFYSSLRITSDNSAQYTDAQLDAQNINDDEQYSNNLSEPEIIHTDEGGVADSDIEQGSAQDDSVGSANMNIWSTNPDIRHWVVVGSYSTEDNANAAIDSHRAVEPDYDYQVYQLGSMYAVVIYGSSEHQECVEFKQTLSNRFSQAWIHTPRRYR